MSKLNPTEINFVCSFDQLGDRNLHFSYVPNQKNMLSKPQPQNHPGNGWQAKPNMGIDMKPISGSLQRSTSSNGNLTVGQPFQSASIPLQGNSQSSQPLQSVSASDAMHLQSNQSGESVSNSGAISQPSQNSQIRLPRANSTPSQSSSSDIKSGNLVKIQNKSITVSDTSLARKNPIYQPIFQLVQQGQQSSQQQQQTQAAPQPPQPPQISQPQPQTPPNQIRMNPQQFQMFQALFINNKNLGQLLATLQNYGQPQFNMIIQQILKQQQQAQSMKELESKSRSRKKPSGNDDFQLRSYSESSKKKADLFIPASTTMYSTHHRNHKSFKDLSDSESDTYIPCTSSSSQPSSSSSSSEEENNDEKEQVKQPARHHAPLSSHSSSHMKKDKKFTYTPFDPKVTYKRRYASWAEITDYGQWKLEAKTRPRIIENPRQSLDVGIEKLTEERSKPLDFHHEFTLIECLKVVSNNLPNLANDNNNDNANSVEENHDSNLPKSDSNSVLNAGISKSESLVSIFSADKNSLASVITPVLTKKRVQIPDHIQLSKILNNFDMKMRSITSRACNMLDRLLLREILKNSAPSLHQSLEQIAPYVWREYQIENNQNAQKTLQSTGGNRRKKKKAVTITTALSQNDSEVEDAFHVIKQTFEFLNVCEKEETNYECEIRHMNFSQDYTFQPSYDDLVRYFRQVKGKFVSRSSSGYVLE